MKIFLFFFDFQLQSSPFAYSTTHHLEFAPLPSLCSILTLQHIAINITIDIMTNIKIWIYDVETSKTDHHLPGKTGYMKNFTRFLFGVAKACLVDGHGRENMDEELSFRYLTGV